MKSRKRIDSGSPFEKNAAYSRAVVQGDWVFVAGTTGYNYASMDISDDVAVQAAQCLKNIAAVLKEADSALTDIVRINYVLPRMADFQACWPVLQQYLGDIRPASMVIEAGLLDPKMKIEMEVTALKA